METLLDPCCSPLISCYDWARPCIRAFFQGLQSTVYFILPQIPIALSLMESGPDLSFIWSGGKAPKNHFIPFCMLD
ncbi:hypothetical protein GOP47_0026439 [Adiantum capillus-veneris]|nr:hypothetical protein GOP47_0026439 [Adiantum capillus-veneris]